MSNQDTLHYYELCTLFPLPGYLDDQCGEFLEIWMANHHFQEFHNLIKYHTTIRTSTLIMEDYTTIENHTLLKDLSNFMYLTQPNFSEDTPNQLLHMLSTLRL